MPGPRANRHRLKKPLELEFMEVLVRERAHYEQHIQAVGPGLKHAPFKMNQLEEVLEESHANYRHWFERSGPNCPAWAVPRLCGAFGRTDVLDWLDHRARERVMQAWQEDYRELADAALINSLVQEVGQAIAKLAETLADGAVEDHELGPTLKEVEDVISECHRLKRILKHKNIEFNRRKPMS